MPENIASTEEAGPTERSEISSQVQSVEANAGAAGGSTVHGFDGHNLPSYDELPELAGLGMRHAWGVFGEHDRVGTMNLLQPSAVVDAARLVTTGEVISLDLPLTLPDPPLFGRQPYVHPCSR
jgi:hypothetical protein